MEIVHVGGTLTLNFFCNFHVPSPDVKLFCKGSTQIRDVRRLNELAHFQIPYVLKSIKLDSNLKKIGGMARVHTNGHEGEGLQGGRVRGAPQCIGFLPASGHEVGHALRCYLEKINVLCSCIQQSAEVDNI